MLLTSIMKNLDFTEIKGTLDREVAAICEDSREASPESLFVAISGFKVDGHDYIDKAIELGATTIVVEKDFWTEAPVTILKVEDTRKALAKISANFYDHPTEKLNLIGITGTNGKTSTTYFVKSIFEQAKKSISLIGTIGTMVGNKKVKNKNTTPDALNLQHTFSDIVAEGIDNCVMEVSSHALSLDRVDECRFNTGIFTNLTPDHLEMHNSMEEYFQAKAKLFHMTSDYNIINVDDLYGRRLVGMVQEYNTQVLTYGIERKADIQATDIHFEEDGTHYTVGTPKGSFEVKVNLPGLIYVYNSLAAVACAYCYNMDFQDIQKGIDEVKSIKGRLETVYQDHNFKVVVDFAHTEDGLEKALTTLRPYVKGKLIVVFGVYSPAVEKGSYKRKAMGKTAAKYADFSVVTSDNPKDLNPLSIIKEIVEAIEEEKAPYHVEVDRKEAIRYAIEHSEKGDCILLAGKGHETAQIVGNKEIPFNEKEIVLEIMRERNELIHK